MIGLIKNKRGNLYLAFTFALMFFILGMMMIPFIQDSITGARTSASCTSSSITDGNKLTCLYLDTGVPYFIILMMVLAGGFIGNEL